MVKIWDLTYNSDWFFEKDELGWAVDKSVLINYKSLAFPPNIYISSWLLSS